METRKTVKFKEDYQYSKSKSFTREEKYHTLEEWQRGEDKQLQVLSSPSDLEPRSLCFLPQQPLAKRHSAQTVEIKYNQKKKNYKSKAMT